MDLSLVYGSSAGQANPIRAFQGGRLLTVLRGGREWPPQDPNITLTCESAQSLNEPCYLMGKKHNQTYGIVTHSSGVNIMLLICKSKVSGSYAIVAAGF